MISYVVCMLAATLAMHGVNGQESSHKKHAKRGIKATDTTVCQRMRRDLNTRSTLTANQEVDWRSSRYGYYGTYSIDSVEYMARYDKDGKYEEILTQKDWNNHAPAKLRSSYAQSMYKLQTVIGYWEISGPDRKGYYLELSNGDGDQPSEVWANEDGTFSDTPLHFNPAPKSNMK